VSPCEYNTVFNVNRDLDPVRLQNSVTLYLIKKSTIDSTCKYANFLDFLKIFSQYFLGSASGKYYPVKGVPEKRRMLFWDIDFKMLVLRI